MMKNTPFTKFHVALGAKMMPFAGYNMPIQYEGVIAEHLTVRKSVGVFDVSHMGEIWVRGPQAFDLVQYITTNDVAKLYDGKVQYSCMPNGKGGIVDDILVYRINAQLYLLVVNAANIEKDWNWITQHALALGMQIGRDVYNASDETAQLAIQGPSALKAMQKLTSASILDMEYYTWKYLEFAGIKNILLSTTGYTGSGGCEIYMPNDAADTIWKAVFESGKEYGIKPIGLGARDTLRLEMGFCLYGNDIDDTTSPLEAGLGWITKFTDTKNFIDKEYLLQQKKEGLKRKLVGFVLKDKGIPRQHYPICNASGNKIGEVTSGTMSPSLNIPIGLGYVPIEFSQLGSEIFIDVRGKLLKAEVVKLPFYKGE